MPTVSVTCTGQGTVSLYVPLEPSFQEELTLTPADGDVVLLICKPAVGFYLQQWLVDGEPLLQDDGRTPVRDVRLSLSVAADDRTVELVFASRQALYLNSFFEMLPEEYRFADESLELEDFCRILEVGLDLVVESADRFDRAPFFLEAGWNRQFLSVFALQDLALKLSDAELRLLLPWLARIMKMKGRGLALFWLLRALAGGRDLLLYQETTNLFLFWSEDTSDYNYPRTFSPGTTMWRTWHHRANQHVYLIEIEATPEEIAGAWGQRILAIARYFVPFYIQLELVSSSQRIQEEDTYQALTLSGEVGDTILTPLEAAG